MTIDKTLMQDSMGKYLIQALFLESYYEERAVYSLKEKDHVWNGKTFPSLRRLYIESYDPTEYLFAEEHLGGWKHWQRLLASKPIRAHIEEWREELEFKIRADAVKAMMESAKAGNYQASKWLADRGWATRGAGRPSKAEIEGSKAVQTRLDNEYGADVIRLMTKV
jgi:hypothetical protein